MGRFFGRVGIGMIVSLPVICILAGGVMEGFLLLLVSIVCTAGIGLVAWIPAWWIVGWGTQKILIRTGIIDDSFERPEHRTDDQFDRASTAVKRHGKRPMAEVRALRAYVRQAMADGMGVEEMTRRLRLNGWEPDEIQSAHRSFLSSQLKDSVT